MAASMVHSNNARLNGAQSHGISIPTRDARAAADALFFLHTSPIMTAMPAPMGASQMPNIALGSSPVNPSAYCYPKLSGTKQLSRVGNAHEQHRDAAGTLCALMATQQQRTSPPVSRSRAVSFMSVDDGEGSMFDPMDQEIRESGPRIGAYSPDSRRRVINRFMEKRRSRIWKKRIKYDVRKNFADSRLRVKGRFVRKEDEEQLRDFLSMTA